MEAAIIYKSEETINFDNINIREQIDDILDEYLTFKEFKNNEEMFSIIHEALGKSNRGITVCNIWENIDTIYAGYFIDITEMIDYTTKNDNQDLNQENHDLNQENHDSQENQDKEYIKSMNEKIKLNKFASQLTAQHVTGNLVIIKKKLSYVITDNNIKTNMEATTLSYTQLCDTMEKVFIKEGIVINTDGSMSTYKFIINPLEHLLLTDPNYSEHYIYHEYEVYNHVLIIIVDLREINGKQNFIATYLSGRPARGTVFVAIYKKPESTENPIYTSLSISKLNNILAIRKKSTIITTGMNPSDKEYVNFEKLLELEIKKHSNKPDIQMNNITGQLLNLNIDINATNQE